MELLDLYIHNKSVEWLLIERQNQSNQSGKSSEPAKEHSKYI